MNSHRIVRWQRNRGFGLLFVVLSASFLLMIYGLSTFFVGQSLSREVAIAEAGRSIRITCDSGIEEAIGGFIRSVNMDVKDIKTDEERAAWEFGQKIRRLGVGEQLRTRFVPENSKKAGLPNGVELHSVEVKLFKEYVRPGDGHMDEADCSKRLALVGAVLAKWSKFPG